MEHARREQIEPYVTRDGSTIRLYLATSGSGLLRVGDEERAVAAGDCVAIPPGTPHRLCNEGEVDLVVACACSPPYSHEDTVLLEGG